MSIAFTIEDRASANMGTKDRIKLAAQILFGRFGIDGVSVQQIVAAAGQRNNASLHYHFGSKEELVRLLVVEGAQQLDDRRHHMLAQVDANGGPDHVREVLDILIRPVVQLSEEQRWFGYIRFIANLQLWNRDVLRQALDGQWNAAYVICLNHLRRMMEQKQPSLVVEQKLSFLGIYANAVLTAREAALERHHAEPHHFWSGDYTLANMIDTLEAMLVSLPSETTLTLLPMGSETK